MTRILGTMLATAFVVCGCKPAPDAPPPTTPADARTVEAAPVTAPAAPDGPARFEKKTIAELEEPWAMTFLPDGRVLVTEKKGTIKIVGRDGRKGAVVGAPKVAYGGQGGLGDVILHPRFADNGMVYLSWAEPGDGDVSGAAVGRAKLILDDQGGGRLDGLTVIWRQSPKVTGDGHFGHRLAFAPDGHLFITSGERQKFDPAQDMSKNLGKVIRLKEDGTVPADNPFASKGGVTAQIWSYGHRNPLGIAFAPDGRLWEHEMGPRGGDELNLIERGSNYGYPIVSNGDHYDGRDIPDHSTRPELNAPEVTWNPVISPAGFVIYTGDMFPAWRGDGFIGGLSSKALIRVDLEGDTAREAERWDMDMRIREVEQGPDGALWLLQDRDDGALLELTPAASR